MKKIEEPAAMKEVRDIRERLSLDLEALSPSERADFIKREADRLMKEFDLDLPRIGKQTIETR